MTELKRYIIWSTVLMSIYLVAQYYKPKPTDWRETFAKEDKIPFGTYILYQELGSIFPDSKIRTSGLPVYNTLKDKGLKDVNYLFVAGAVNMDEYDYQELVNFIENGNNAFIAAYELSDLLKDTLNLTMASVFTRPNTTGTKVNFVNPNLKRAKDYVFNKGLGDQYFAKVDTARATVLGRNVNGDASFIKYTFGKGGLYLLPSPKLLSNYNLLSPSGSDYIAKVLSTLPKAGQVIWDENNTKGNVDDDSVLRVLFKNDPLRWAYYLAICGLLIFVFFEMKRRQRIIPVVEPLKNTSVDFVEVVGKIYYQQRDNRDIAQKKTRYFLEYVRTNYRLKTTSLNEEFIHDLVLKSGIGEGLVRELTETINRLNGGVMVNDDALIQLNELIEKFYKQGQ